MLKEQSIEAETLHRNTDRRGVAVRKIVSAHLGETETKAYDTFLDNLIRLVTDLKETEQRIQLGEEQLIHLNDNLVTPPQPASSSSVTSTPWIINYNRVSLHALLITPNNKQSGRNVKVLIHLSGLTWKLEHIWSEWGSSMTIKTHSRNLNIVLIEGRWSAVQLTKDFPFSSGENKKYVSMKSSATWIQLSLFGYCSSVICICYSITGKDILKTLIVFFQLLKCFKYYFWTHHSWWKVNAVW